MVEVLCLTTAPYACFLATPTSQELIFCAKRREHKVSPWWAKEGLTFTIERT